MDGAEELIRQSVLSKIDLSRTLCDDEVLSQIRTEICAIASEYPISVEKRKKLEKKIFNSLRRLDIIEDFLEDDAVSEIMINGPDHIFIEKNGEIIETGLTFRPPERLLDLIQHIAGKENKVVNETRPILDTRLPESGARVNIVLPPAAVDCGIITIRKFPKDPITMEKLIRYKTLSREIAEFLKDLVEAGYNIMISGGTSSGKTTFLNALTEYVPRSERVITIEDSAELQVRGIADLVRLESRQRSLDGNLEISIRDLVKTSLRMRPDRIIIGECRGAEALELLQALNTGHDGTMGTLHANSAEDTAARIETMVLQGGIDLPVRAIRQQIVSGIDIFIHLGRMRDRSRKLLEIRETDGIANGEVRLRPLYLYKGDGVWQKEGELKKREKLIRSGHLSA